MRSIFIDKANSRGHAIHGWLESFHTFSFASYYNPDRMHFGVLRVLNDDFVKGEMGFGTHPHDNMEIISIGLKGSIEHKDSMGNRQVIKAGEIQVMSAGTGIEHSEFNPAKEDLNFLQIWIYPKEKDVVPRYQQMRMLDDTTVKGFRQILSPNPEDDGVWIHQDAWMFLGKFSAGDSDKYTLHNPLNGLYVFLISGSVEIEDHLIDTRDGMGISGIETTQVKALTDSEILMIEVPLKNK
jgi:redox-sensitive bicupin YhaK (pirin superfamily)